ncbi:MAG: hypothetical protein DRI69_10020 [Bacteroidetes bacterium]|nr:MAG: hypothetical protein DRI69_10020 [Bacteroidota bacterium]
MKIFQKCMLLVLALYVCQLTAQSDFAPLGAAWTYTYVDHIPMFPTYRPIVFVVEDIVTWQGHLCSKIIVPEPPVNGDFDTLYLFDRNDSVYYWSDFSVSFELLYDFTAEPDDSWTIEGLSVTDTTEFDPFLTVFIDSINFSIYNNDTLRVMHHAPSMYFDWGNAIIEGLGSDGFMLPIFGLYESRLGGLRCYSDANVDYNLTDLPCDTVIFNIVDGTEDVQLVPHFKIMPNPASDRLFIRQLESGGAVNVKVVDLLGNVFLSDAVGIDAEFNIAFLTPGVYFVMFFDKSTLVQAERFLKL